MQDQFLRASSSIGLNLAEGSGKRTPADQRRFYGIAFGSLKECQAILELEQVDRPDIIELGDQLGAILYTLSRTAPPQTGMKPKPRLLPMPQPLPSTDDHSS